MENETENIIKDQMEKLPAEIRQAIASFDWASKIQEVGRKNGLLIDQLGALQNEVLLVLIGLTYPDDFTNKLKENINLPEDKVSAIVNDSNEMIFKPIRESLVKIYEENLTDADLEEPGTADTAMKAAGIEVLGGIVGDKMNAPFRLPKQETDLSLTKTPVLDQKDLPSPGVIDPYREKTL